MLNPRDSWDDCYALAERLKQQSLRSDQAEPPEISTDEAMQATQEAIASLKRRAKRLQQRYR